MSGIAVHPLNGKVYVTTNTTGNVFRMDADFTHPVQAVDVACPYVLRGLAFDPSGNMLLTCGTSGPGFGGDKSSLLVYAYNPADGTYDNTETVVTLTRSGSLGNETRDVSPGFPLVTDNGDGTMRLLVSWKGNSSGFGEIGTYTWTPSVPSLVKVSSVGSGGSAYNQFDNPGQMALSTVNGTEYLFIRDEGNFRVQVVRTSDGTFFSRWLGRFECQSATYYQTGIAVDGSTVYTHDEYATNRMGLRRWDWDDTP